MEKYLAYLAILAIGVAVGASLAIAVNYISNSSSPEKHSVVFAVEMNDHSAAFWVAYDQGWFGQEGIDVVVKTFSTGLDLAIEMSRGDIDVALVCIGPALVLRSRGVHVKLVSMTHLQGYALVARPMYSSVEELSGKPVSVSGPGSPTWLLAKMVMDKYKVSFDLRKMPPFIAVNALLSGKVEAAFLPEHYVSLAESMDARVLLRSQDLWPKMPGSGVLAKENFLKEHPDLVEKIVKILSRACDFINENFSDAAKIVAKRLATDYGVMEKSMKYLNYTTEIDPDEIGEYIDLLVKFGALEEPVSTEEFIDLEFIGG